MGKTTLLKQWMARLLEQSIAPQRIAFFSGELIDDHHTLLRLMTDQLAAMPAGWRCLLIDEVSYIRGWERAVKYAADAGYLQDVTVVLTGSDLVLIEEARLSLPGRRGGADRVDFYLYPLSFAETFKLTEGSFDPTPARAEPAELQGDQIEALGRAFDRYLVHGGYLTAINDMASNDRVAAATLATYADWIRGDFAKRGKNEARLREVLTAILRRQGGQVTWNALSRDLSIEHPATVADYVGLLGRMGAAGVLPALREDRLSAAPKKARKLFFSDPFIHHAIRHWLEPAADLMANEITPTVTDPSTASALVEAVVASHCQRTWPTFYIKGKGEVDVAVVQGGDFWPVEVKWTRQIRAKDLKQVASYGNGLVLTRQPGVRLGAVATAWLPLWLLCLPVGEPAQWPVRCEASSTP